MTSRDRVIQALNHQPVDRVPRDLWASPAMEMLCADELAEMNFRYASDLVKPDFQYPRGSRTRGKRYEVGEYTDAWGCVWEVAERGTEGQLKFSPLADPAQLAGYRPPWDLLDQADLSGVNRSCAATSRFVLARSETRPFERLQLLHGPQATIAELTVGSGRLRELLAMLHEFSCREMEMWASTDVDGVVLRDDWGSRNGLLVPVQLWRDAFRPLYREYCRILRKKDKFVFFHCGGNITEIFRDLVQIGIDAIRCDLAAMNLEALARRYRGRITFCAESDRQQVLPHGTPEDVRAAVRRLQKALDYGRGGLIAHCEWTLGVPFLNVAAALEQWVQPVPMHA